MTPLASESSLRVVDNPVGIVDNRPDGSLPKAARLLIRRVRSARKFMLSVLRTLVLQLIRGYQQWISPGLAPRCRFYPSCSSYAVEAISVHGLGRGGVLAVRRLLRCHPWNPGGLDPVPPPWPAGEHDHPAQSASRLTPCQDTPGA